MPATRCKSASVLRLFRGRTASVAESLASEVSTSFFGPVRGVLAGTVPALHNGLKSGNTYHIYRRLSEPICHRKDRKTRGDQFLGTWSSFSSCQEHTHSCS